MHLPPIAAALLVLLPFALITVHAAGEQRLSLPPLWSFSADLSFPSSSSLSSTLNAYSQLAPFSLFAPILSSPAFSSGSKGFSFGFLSLFQSPSSPPSQISLSICLGVQHSSGNGGSPFLVPVWTLNTTTTLKQQGKSLVKLQVNKNKQLSLVDGDGRVAWSLSNVVDSMEMQSNGNLVIYGSDNGSIWQSFDHPSDCLLQGQRLKLGMELTSSNNMYKAVMQAGGVVFYQVSPNPFPLVYWIYPVNSTVEDYFEDMVGAFSLDKHAPVNLTSSLALDHPSCAAVNKSLAYYLVDGDRYVMQDACASTKIVPINASTDLLRLDTDGLMRDYYVQQLPNSSYALTSTSSNYKPCFIPNVCGAYGICSVSSTFGTAVSHTCSERKGQVLTTMPK